MPALWSHPIEHRCGNGYGRCRAVSVWVFPSRQHSRLVSNFPSLHNIMEDTVITSSAHTRGPWAVFGIKTDAPLIHTVKEGPAGVMVAIVSKEWGIEQEKEANAQLIAAAPDLLEACFIAALELHCPDGDDHECGAFAVINDAIAKAQGK